MLGSIWVIHADGTAAGFNIYTANANRTGLTQVTFGGSDDDPAWGTHPPAPKRFAARSLLV